MNYFTYLVKEISTSLHLNQEVAGNFRRDRPAYEGKVYTVTDQKIKTI